mmetsp:Transcript_61079/g.189207  ORF Transcript_61079/g.189207 Transcript_61079/m.189207 type:complete len:206 (+) Transcript_61079:1191-1808(+)
MRRWSVSASASLPSLAKTSARALTAMIVCLWSGPSVRSMASNERRRSFSASVSLPLCLKSLARAWMEFCTATSLSGSPALLVRSRRANTSRKMGSASAKHPRSPSVQPSLPLAWIVTSPSGPCCAAAARARTRSVSTSRALAPSTAPSAPSRRTTTQQRSSKGSPFKFFPGGTLAAFISGVWTLETSYASFGHTKSGTQKAAFGG